MSIESIIQSELSKLLKSEIADGLQSIFQNTKNQAPITHAQNTNQNMVLNIVINNNASVAVTTSERTDAFDRKTLEITIDQMVANALTQGRQTSGVMRGLFGLVPPLIGR